MEAYENDLRGFVEDIARIPAERGAEDYCKDGILTCGKCGEAKQAWIDWFPDENGNREKRLVRVMCRCDVERDRKEKERRAAVDFEFTMRKINAALQTEPGNVRWTFDMDDSPDSPFSATCRTYAAEWEAMKREHSGILFYGSKGNGKTFYASCICNAILEKRESVGFTTAANLMNILSAWDKTEILDAIRRVRLLVIDDLGTERSSSYGAELMYSVIDTRYKTGLPTIVTTNMDLADMESETDILRSRIYDRVIEMCPIKLKMLGGSRRAMISDTRTEAVRRIMRDALRQGGAK